MTIIDRLFTLLVGDNVSRDDPYWGLAPEIRRRVQRDIELRQAEWAFHAEHGRLPTHTELWAKTPPDVGGEDVITIALVEA